MDDNGNLLPRGQVGELVHRGPNVMMGYYKDPKATEEARKFGWHHTGDLALIDEHGEVLFLDRKKDMIKSGGFNVYPKEVEEVLYRHPGVREAAVIGLPDPKWIEAVTAVVVLDDPAVEAELVAYCRDQLAGYKVPKTIHVLDALPRTSFGKFDKKELQQRLSAVAGGASS